MQKGDTRRSTRRRHKPVTPADVVGWFNEAFERGSIPDESQVQTLCTLVNGMERGQYHDLRQDRPFLGALRKAQSEVERAVAEARRNLRTGAERLPDDTAFLGQLAGEVAELQRLLESVEVVQQRFDPRGKERRQDWHSVALILEDAVQRSLRRAGRKSAGVTSSRSPAVAVVQRALGEMGIHQEKSAVSTMFHRKRPPVVPRRRPQKRTT